MNITENEEFNKAKAKLVQDTFDIGDVKRTSEIGFELGGECAQTILQAEHDKETIDFDIWKMDLIFTGRLSLTDNITGDLVWILSPHKELTPDELFNIFRKERGNDRL